MKTLERTPFAWLTFCLLLPGLLTTALPLRAQDDEPEPPAQEEQPDAAVPADLPTAPAEDTSWHPERDELVKKAKTELTKQVNSKITKELVAKQLGFKLPVEAPSMQVNDVRDQARSQAIREVEEKYPYSLLKDLSQQAERMYPLHQIGDQVELVRRGGVGMNTRVRGPLKAVSEERIRVGSVWILRSDLIPEQQVLFYKDQNELSRTQFMHRKQIELRRTRKNHFLSRFNAIAGKLYEANNYASHEGKWLPKVQILDIMLAAKKKEATVAMKPVVEETVFLENGYVRYEDEWVPNRIAEERKLKAMLARQNGAAAEGETAIPDEALGEPVNGSDIPPQAPKPPSEAPDQAPPESDGLFDEAQ